MDREHDCLADGQWVDGYYGYVCTICGQLAPYGCEPWAPDEDSGDEPDLDEF